MLPKVRTHALSHGPVHSINLYDPLPSLHLYPKWAYLNPDSIQWFFLFIRSLSVNACNICPLWVQVQRRQEAYRYRPSTFLAHVRANLLPVSKLPCSTEMRRYWGKWCVHVPDVFLSCCTHRKILWKLVQPLG
jgi:hypothetical protein